MAIVPAGAQIIPNLPGGALLIQARFFGFFLSPPLLTQAVLSLLAKHVSPSHFVLSVIQLTWKQSCLLEIYSNAEWRCNQELLIFLLYQWAKLERESWVQGCVNGSAIKMLARKA